MKLKINNNTVQFFSSFHLDLNFDAVASSFSFNVRFDPDNQIDTDLFKPLSFPRVEVWTDDDRLLLTGVIVNHNFTSSAIKNLVRISGYSLGGVLEDCNIPYTEYPLESLKRSLKDIASKLLGIFDLTMIIDKSAQRDMDLQYEKTIASPGESIKGYLAKLAAQRNIVLSHNSKGDIIFFKPSFSASPVFSFNSSNAVTMALAVKVQGFQSKLWVLRQPSKRNQGLTPVDVLNNPLIGAFRPGVKVLSSGTDTDTAKAVKNAMSAQIKNVSLTISLQDWFEVIPGDVINVKNDDLFLFEETKFVASRYLTSKTLLTKQCKSP